MRTLAVEGRLDRGLLGAALYRAADVEGAHGELGARLADRLRGDDAHRLADIDDGAAREVAAIALAAKPDRRLAGQHRADQDAVDAGTVDALDHLLVDEVARGDDELAVQRIDDVDGGGAAEDAVGQSGAMTSPPSTTARMVRPRVVPQSSSVMIASCATSTRRRVR